MSRPSDSRRHRRRTKLSDYLPGGILVLGICALGFYLTQDPQTLEQLRNSLGFGKATTSAPAASNGMETVDVESQAVDPVDAMKLPFPEGRPGRKSQRFASLEEPNGVSGDGESEAYFQPVSHGRRAPELAKSEPTDWDNLGLDERFEAEPIDSVTLQQSAGYPRDDAVDTDEMFEAPTVTPRQTVVQATVPTVQRPFRAPRGGTGVQNELLLTAGEQAKPRSAVRRPVRPPVPKTPVSTAAVATVAPKGPDLTAVQNLIDAGQDIEAYHLLNEMYQQSPAQRPLIQKPLEELAARIYFSPQPQVEPPYEIQPGDQLRKIANKYQLSWQYLSRLNQVDARKIRPGKLLKVFQGPFSARVDMSDYELTVFLNGQFVRRYSVGLGKMNSTPIGEFTVREKLENPTYYGPNGMVLDADDPQNPLGERWIDIGNSFGIHGTIEPDSIGKSESAGCVRMRNDEVAEVYELLTIGSQVIIQR